MRWLDFLFPPRDDERVLRGIAPDAFLSLLSPQIVSATTPHTTALLPFQHPWVRAAIHEAKYKRSEAAFALLSKALADYVRDADVLQPQQIILVPIPLGPTRQRERGLNQAEEIALRAAREIGCTVDTTLLVRTRETLSQVSLPRGARQENMRGAFAATRSVAPGAPYLLIDDVTTTGATLQAAIDVLENAGATQILSIALAH